MAVFAALIAWVVHRREARRQEEAELSAERSQADLVTAWETAYRVPDEQVDEVPTGILSEQQIANYGTYVHVTRLVMTLVNRSSQPVYDVKLNAEGTESAISLDILPPGEQKIGLPRYAVSDYSLNEVNKNEHLLNISFRDAAGNWWVRKAKGELTKVASKAEHDVAMGEVYDEGQKSLHQFLLERGQ